MLHIQQGIDQAEAEQRLIDDATARRIASQLHSGQASPLYSLASSGAVDAEAVTHELDQNADDPEADEHVRHMARHLGNYALAHDGREPIDGWYKLTSDEPETPEVDPEPEPRVWIGALGAYNQGDLHGVWVRADKGVEHLQRHVDAIVATSPAEGDEEYYIADTDNFKGLDIHEYASIPAVAELGRLVSEHGEPFVHYAQHVGYDDVDGLEQAFEDAYRGEYPSRAAYVDEVLTETEAYDFLQAVPEWLRDHVSIDLDGVGDLWESDGLVVVDSNNRSVVYIYDGRE